MIDNARLPGFSSLKEPISAIAVASNNAEHHRIRSITSLESKRSQIVVGSREERQKQHQNKALFLNPVKLAQDADCNGPQGSHPRRSRQALHADNKRKTKA